MALEIKFLSEVCTCSCSTLWCPRLYHTSRHLLLLLPCISWIETLPLHLRWLRSCLYLDPSGTHLCWSQKTLYLRSRWAMKGSYCCLPLALSALWPYPRIFHCRNLKDFPCFCSLCHCKGRMCRTVLGHYCVLLLPLISFYYYIQFKMLDAYQVGLTRWLKKYCTNYGSLNVQSYLLPMTSRSAKKVCAFRDVESRGLQAQETMQRILIRSWLR